MLPGYFKETQTEMTKEKNPHDKTYVETPPELIDFVLNSIKEIAKSEFGADINNDKNVSIIDPFAGTGQFLNRAADTKIITPDHKSKITQIEIDADRAAQAKKTIDKKLKNVKTINADTFLLDGSP